MPKPRDASAGSGEAQVKVVDRRRFTPDGDSIDSPEQARESAGVERGDEVAPAPPGPEDARIAEQAARIDELSRAYAALLEDNKAFRGRLEREKERVVDAERASVAQVLLEAADELERALEAATGALDEGGEAARVVAEGVRLSLGTLHRRIGVLGAERIAVAGQPFDPKVAEAVDTVAVADAEQDGMVLHEVTPGWRIGDRILRAARVRVGRLARA